jgi:exodeoxyribonuclease X
LEFILKPSYKAIIFDTETHDLGNPELIQAALLEVDFIDGTLKRLSEWKGDYKPENPITYGAMAVHHIMDEDLVDCPPSSSFALPETTYLIGHNIMFDYKVIGKPKGVLLIDTLALARSVFTDPQLTSYTQSALTYYLARPVARKVLKDAHDALADVKLCYGILYHICRNLNITSLEDLHKQYMKVRIPKVIPFGRYKGKLISEIPSSYKAWYARSEDPDPLFLEAFGYHDLAKKIMETP